MSSSSIMSFSDFNDSLIEDENGEEGLAKKQKIKRKGACCNMWKMATHTRIVP